MDRIVDYLAEEEARAAQKAAKRTLKEGKKDRIAKLLKKLAVTETHPVVDYLAMGD